MADQKTALNVTLTLGQVLALIVASHIVIACICSTLAWHYVTATSYALDRTQWRCSKAKKNSPGDGDRPELWRGGYYYPSEAARESGCVEYARVQHDDKAGQ